MRKRLVIKNCQQKNKKSENSKRIRVKRIKPLQSIEEVAELVRVTGTGYSSKKCQNILFSLPY